MRKLLLITSLAAAICISTASAVAGGEMDFGTISINQHQVVSVSDPDKPLMINHIQPDFSASVIEVDNDTVTPSCSGCHTASGISLSMQNNGFSGITFTGYDNYHSGKIIRTNL